MTQDELAGLTDQELLQEIKKNKSTSLINAVMFGVMIGIAMYSTWKNGIGFFTLIPLFLPIWPLIIQKRAKPWKRKSKLEIYNEGGYVLL